MNERLEKRIATRSANRFASMLLARTAAEHAVLRLPPACREDLAASPKFTVDPYPCGLAVLLLALAGYRYLALSAADLALYFDEAYYWIWSREPAFGYYSKPPMIAWLMRATSSICGDGEPCLRSAALGLFSATAWLNYATTAFLFDRRTGFFAGLAYAGLPVVSFYSWLMTTDALLAFFWSLALFGLVRALRHDRLRDWLIVGGALGLGLLSKYTMAVFLVSALICLVWIPEQRKQFRNPRVWIALALAGFIFLPNLAWNLGHGWASFKHTAATAQWGGEWFHLDRLLLFLGAQTLLLGPPLCVAVLIGWRRSGFARRWDERYRFLLCFALPLPALYSFQALIARANFNWAMAAFAPAAALAAACLLRAGLKRTLIFALALNFLLGSAVYHYGALAERLGIPLSQTTDIYVWMKGWRELGAAVQNVMARYPDAGLAGDNRRILSELIYYVRPHPLDAAIWNPSGKISDHFRLNADLSRSRRKRFLFVTETTPIEALRSSFESVTDLGTLEIPVHPDYGLRCRLFLLSHFMGYRS